MRCEESILRNNTFLVWVLMLLPIGFCPAVYALDVYTEIESAQAKPIDIALPLFTCSQSGNEALLQEIHRIFTNDLSFSGRFNVVSVADFLPTGTKEMTNPDFSAWYLVGIQALITGHVNPGETDLEINMRLFDIPMGQQIIGIKYQTPMPKVRGAIHKFADEVQFRLTGERGISFSKIAFVSNKSGAQEIYMADPDGGDLVQLTRNRTINLSPAWSPDLSKIYFTSFLNKRPDLFSMDIESKTVKPVLKGGMNITPSLSPDGGTLAVSISFDGDPEIILINLQSNTQKRLTFSPGVDSNPSFSPNGQEIVFSSDRAGGPQIYIMNAEGANIRRLTFIGPYNTAPEWSPRGDWIAYHSRQEGVFDVWLIHPDGSDEHPLTSQSGHNEDPTWARDGRHIAFVSTRSGGKGLFVTDISGRDVRPVLVHGGECVNPSWSR